MRAAASALVLFAFCAGVSSCTLRRPTSRSTGTVTRTPRPGAPAEPAATAEEAPTPAESPSGEPAEAPYEAAMDEAEPAPSDGAAEAAAPAADDRPAIEVLEGRASFYADRFHGRPTASGETYDMHALTAASRDLPFGTIVRVVRVETGATVVIRVNDRGPFRDHSRILDLSRAAAEALDMIEAGVVEIRAEILERGDGSRWRGEGD